MVAVLMVHKGVRPSCISVNFHNIIDVGTRYSSISTAWVEGKCYLLICGLWTHYGYFGQQTIATDSLETHRNVIFILIYINLAYRLMLFPYNKLKEPFIDRQ